VPITFEAFATLVALYFLSSQKIRETTTLMRIAVVRGK
jgi:hypothetical protein